MQVENLFQCECNTHLIGVDYDPEFEQTYLSFYYYANLRSSLWYRIKRAFNILLDRRFEIDTFVLSQSEAVRLGSKLIKDKILSDITHKEQGIKQSIINLNKK